LVGINIQGVLRDIVGNFCRNLPEVLSFTNGVGIPKYIQLTELFVLTNSLGTISVYSYS
jgi:hypothetical protein